MENVSIYKIPSRVFSFIIPLSYSLWQDAKISSNSQAYVDVPGHRGYAIRFCAAYRTNLMLMETTLYQPVSFEETAHAFRRARQNEETQKERGQTRKGLRSDDDTWGVKNLSPLHASRSDVAEGA